MPARRSDPALRPALRGWHVAALAAALGLSLGATSAAAERADRSKPLTIDADKSGTFDLGKKVVTYVGNVVVAQGSLAIRAEHVELRQLADGRRVATALGVAGRPATFRQKREGLDETIEGTAERIEYDDRSDTVRFVGAAAVRRLRGAATADEISGGLITYDNLAEIFVVQGRPSGSADGSGRDRVRAIFTPVEDKNSKDDKNHKNGKDNKDVQPAPSAPSSR
jgi:lipopolysaccharide export system protein LptA